MGKFNARAVCSAIAVERDGVIAIRKFVHLRTQVRKNIRGEAFYRTPPSLPLPVLAAAVTASEEPALFCAPVLSCKIAQSCYVSTARQMLRDLGIAFARQPVPNFLEVLEGTLPG